MTTRMRLSDREWLKIVTRVEGSSRGRGRPPRDNRNFIEAVLWIHRTGAPWRDLPVDFGSWNTVFNRFDRWAKTGRWSAIFQALQTDVDGEWHSIDSTINRAHQHAAGGKGGPKATPSEFLGAVVRRRCISSSMRSDCQSLTS